MHPESKSAVNLIPLINTGNKMASTGFSKATVDRVIFDQFCKVEFLGLFKSLETTLAITGPESLVKGLTGLGENPGDQSNSQQNQHSTH